jgi:branched-chain amino acid transport system substrate-binding protein
MRSAGGGARVAIVVMIGCLAAAHMPIGVAWGLETRTVYSSLPLVGEQQASTEDVVRGEQLALEQAGSTVDGVPVRLVSLNDGSEGSGRWAPGAVASDAERAAQDPSTIAYFGEFNSAASAISIPILNEAGILQVSPSNTYVGLTRPEGADFGEPLKYYPTGARTYGRVAPADHLQARAMSRYLQIRGVRRVFLVDDGEVYGKGLADLVRARLRGRGVAVVGRARLAKSARNASAVARQVRRARAGAMFFGGITENGAVRLWREVHRVNPSAALFGGDGIGDSFFTRQIPRGAALRTRVTLPARPPSAYPPSAQAFFAAFRARFGHPAQPYAIFGYETMALALDCLHRAGPGADRAAIVAQFFSTRDRESVLGRYSIDRFGDTTLPLYGGYRVSNLGNLVYDRTLDSSR